MGNGAGSALPAAAELRDGLLVEVIEALTEGLAIFDENATLVCCNARVRSMSNGLLADLLEPGLGWAMFLRELSQREVVPQAFCDRLAAMEAALGDDGPPARPLELQTRGGLVFHVALRPTETGGFLLTIRDVTARHRLQENSREADELLQKVLEACPANVVMSRVGDGQILYRSPAATELLGTTRHAQGHFASREERADFVTALLPDGRVDDMPITGLRPDGTRFPCLVSARLIDYRGDEVMVSSTVDISKEVALRRTLAEQREQIFQAEKMSALGELLAGVAHELNNPLSVVVGHALMLRDETADPETLRRVEKISDAAERCARIVKSFLAMARQQPVTLAPMDLAETVEMAVDALKNGAEGLATEVTVTVEGTLPRIRGDAHQLAQVVLNLVTNADQAIRDGGKGDRIDIVLRHDTPAAMVELTVADNGPGVPNALHRRIFDPMFTTKPIGAGTGLGLALAHRAVLAHDGSIRIEPDQGTGAVFTIRLPVTSQDETARRAEAAPSSGPARARILVVDDEADVADLIREILVKDGFDVEAAASGEQALERLEGQRYALILTDLNMPGMGGRGFFERVLRDHPAMAGRIGFVTGDTMSPQVRAFLDSAGRPCLEKPIAPAELRKLARTMLAGGREAGR